MGEDSRGSHFMKVSKKTAIWWIDENMRSPSRHVLKIPHLLVLLLQYEKKVDVQCSTAPAPVWGGKKFQLRLLFGIPQSFSIW